jgi:hypothetical protein
MITKAILRRAMEALRYKAQMEAGMSEEPNLFAREETQEWVDAGVIAFHLRNGIVMEDQLTANQLILLLQIYRGLHVNDEASRIGTHYHDIEHLVAKGLVRAGSTDQTLWEPTQAGNMRVLDALWRVK